MMLSLTKTVRDVALELPQATRVFQKLKIDYCCGGEQSLAEACANAGVDVANLGLMLESAGWVEAQGNGAFDFQKATAGELIGHIREKHHTYTKTEMARLEPLLDQVIAAHGENHSELRDIGKLFQTLCADLRPHMFKEEQILFPYILELEKSFQQNHAPPMAPFGTVKNPILTLMTQHDTAGELLREIRVLSSDYLVPPYGCVSYRTLYQALTAFEGDLHQHIHLENNILFPRAVDLEARI